MIPVSRFVANKALDFDGWLAARRNGVTATEVARAATKSGFDEVVASFAATEEIPDNPYMEFGRRMEGPIALWLKDLWEVMPNEWLISAAGNPQHLATPDGLSLKHDAISEIKTTGKDFGTIPVQYKRQVQWQLYVTGTHYCYFAWLLRAEASDGSFVPGWIDPKYTVIERDDKMVEELLDVADRLWAAKQAALAIPAGS